MSSVNITLTDTSTLKEFANMLSTITKNEEVKVLEPVQLYNCLSSNIEQVFKCSDDQVDTIFTLAISTLASLGGDSAKLFGELISLLSTNTLAKVNVRLHLLKFMFNSIPISNKFCYSIYCAILKVVVDASVPHVLANTNKHIDDWIAVWDLSSSETSQLYRQVSHVYFLLNEFAIAQEFNVKALQQGDDSLEVVLKVALYSINTPASEVSTSQYAAYPVILNLPAINTLTGENAPAVDLLNILASGTPAQFNELIVKDNVKAFIEKHDVDIENVRINVTALTLSSSCCTEMTYTYEQLREILGVSNNSDVEEAIIESTFCGQIVAKLNQVDNTVVFTSIKPRTYNVDTWISLRDKIASWKTNTLPAFQTSMIVESTSSQ